MKGVNGRPLWRKIGVEHDKYSSSNYSNRSGRSPPVSGRNDKSNTSLDNDIDMPATHNLLSKHLEKSPSGSPEPDPMAQFMKKMEEMGLECEEVQ